MSPRSIFCNEVGKLPTDKIQLDDSNIKLFALNDVKNRVKNRLKSGLISPNLIRLHIAAWGIEHSPVQSANTSPYHISQFLEVNLEKLLYSRLLSQANNITQNNKSCLNHKRDASFCTCTLRLFRFCSPKEYPVLAMYKLYTRKQFSFRSQIKLMQDCSLDKPVTLTSLRCEWGAQDQWRCAQA